MRHGFTADAPDQLWLTDITEHRTAEGKRYFGASLESCFALLQKNALDCKWWKACQQLGIAFVTRIERKYHRGRRQARVGRLTPIVYKRIMSSAVSLAA